LRQDMIISVLIIAGLLSTGGGAETSNKSNGREHCLAYFVCESFRSLCRVGHFQ